MRVAAALGLWFAAVGAAQTVTVYSELTRIDPLGQPVRADRGAAPPREILSPAIARHATSSFQMVVEGQPDQPYTFQVAQNPDNAVTITAYREVYTRVGDEWIPDVLEPVKLPYDGRLAEVPGQTAQAFWVDVFAARTAPVRRIRIEAQLFMDGGWIVYPMEVRVRTASLGLTSLPRTAGVADVSMPAAASTFAAWRRALCDLSDEKKPPEASLSIRNLIARNASQDVRLAGGVPPPGLLRLMGVADRTGFCRSSRHPARGGEEYLVIRDSLIGAVE